MSGNCGGGALRDIKLMQDIISAIRANHADINLSAKIRLGYDDISEMEEIIPALLEGDKLDFLVVHCRVVQEGYRKIDDHYERFARAKELARNLPLVVNGDIASRREGFSYMQKLGVQGFMCARTFLANPFLFIKDVVTEADKELFYKTTLSVAENDLNCPYTIGKKIELSKLIFGKDNPYFEELKQQHLQSID
jgi:tRNA-dihydrouridine synthase